MLGLRAARGITSRSGWKLEFPIQVFPSDVKVLCQAKSISSAWQPGKPGLVIWRNASISPENNAGGRTELHFGVTRIWNSTTREIETVVHPRFSLPVFASRHTKRSFFESDGHGSIKITAGRRGNPVRIGDGCATVTDYKLPQPLAQRREGGSEVMPEVRIPVWLCSSVAFRALRDGTTSPSKRRMRPAALNRLHADSLNAFIPRFAGG